MEPHKNTKHGHAGRKRKSKTWLTWSSMQRRCDCPSQDSYPIYGGRGITVAPEWRDFENFLRDMGEQPQGTTIDRIDPNGNYAPGNCRWETQQRQQRNKRNNVSLTFDGLTMCMTDWAEKIGIKPRTLRARLFEHGWTLERALTAPVTDLLDVRKMGAQARWGTTRLKSVKKGG